MAESLEHRVLAALDRNRCVAPIDVLTGLGWLRPEHVEAWRRGRVPTLSGHHSLGKLSKALRILRSWAEPEGLQPRETAYAAWQKPPPATLHQDRRSEPGACLPYLLGPTRSRWQPNAERTGRVTGALPGLLR
jgi:hypothetical protein